MLPHLGADGVCVVVTWASGSSSVRVCGSAFGTPLFSFGTAAFGFQEK